MHKPVLLKEVIKNLDIQPNDKVLDGTVGGGGYFREICHLIDKRGLAIGLDQDKSVIDRMRSENLPCERHFVNENFRNLDNVLNKLKINQVDKIVFDLGISSDQLDESGRGFSFQKEEPLSMTLKTELGEDDLTAEEIVNNWEEENLADIIFGYGEERFAKKIANKICEVREERPIKTTLDLIEVIRSSVPQWYQNKRIHFATKTFQALRIAVNDEVRTLEEGLKKGFEHLASQGRMAVVSFHSKEDRLVKRFFKEIKTKQKGILITKKPIIPTRNEILENPRSRSAKLRVIEKNK